jgi:plastocyanin
VVVQRVSAAAPATAAKVSIANFLFAPATLTIAPGQTVTWTNDDGAPHGLAYKDGAKGTDVLLPGASFSRTYDKPGTFDYLCAVHPYMTGKVIVQAR